MSEWQHFGDPLPERPADSVISELELRLLPLDMIVQWRRCGIVSDMLAEFFSYNFRNREPARQALSFAINELLENVVKFPPDKREPVRVHVSDYGDVLRIWTLNRAESRQRVALEHSLLRIVSQDAEQLFLEQIEHGAKQGATTSGLGLITVKKDYQARLAARIRPLEHVEQFEVMAFIELDAEALERE